MPALSSKKGKGFKGYVPPTTVRKEIKFKQWIELAKAADAEKKNEPEKEHVYFMAAANQGDKSFICKDLKSFCTKSEPNFFISEPQHNKGIQCRFGMRGIIAESHFDAGRNFVGMFRGTKRYVLTPPESCKHLGVVADAAHPSHRQSIIDWGDLKQAEANHFEEVSAIETVMHAGEVLYIPSF